MTSSGLLCARPRASSASTRKFVLLRCHRCDAWSGILGRRARAAPRTPRHYAGPVTEPRPACAARAAVARGLVEVGAHPLALWSAFGLIHLWLIAYNLVGPGLPLGDVTLVYRFWVEQGLIANDWVGIDSSWVYPIVALVPMLAAYVLGPDPYPVVWLVIVMLMNAGALLVIAGTGRRVRDAAAAWWWMLFLLALVECINFNRRRFCNYRFKNTKFRNSYCFWWWTDFDWSKPE